MLLLLFVDVDLGIFVVYVLHVYVPFSSVVYNRVVAVVFFVDSSATFA